jgi:hypothetical protein
VTAVNVYGDSITSIEGNGAIIITNPDAPLSLAEDESFRDSSTFGLKWNEGFENGGNQISEFVLSMADVNGDYLVIESGITAALTGSTQVTGLTFGTTYKFKV